MRIVTQTTTRYFPDDPKNKVFAVDVWVTVSRSMKVEAKDRDEAEQKAEEELLAKLHGCCTPVEEVDVLRDMAFEVDDEIEYKTSGEADKRGEIRYY